MNLPVACAVQLKFCLPAFVKHSCAAQVTEQLRMSYIPNYYLRFLPAPKNRDILNLFGKNCTDTHLMSLK